ncbi:MAG: LytTR family transcriptional regulator DNA-binding domain-containing protein [Defluviitaleaceae bacterium]|nr:LytTR family transcriptional regulator DNA-binding domain-containing protein [Defluviitaleaceae bacterium]
MRIIIQDPKPGEEESIIINVRTMTDKISRVIDMLKSPGDLTVYADDQALMLPISAVYYAESVEQKTFVYAEKEVYRSRLKLYEIEDILSTGDFLRVSKQIIVNIRKIRSIAPAGEGRFAAKLINNETVIISRQFVPALKGRFGI